jgi:hypothetical protein
MFIPTFIGLIQTNKINIVFELTTFKMTFRDRIIVRKIDVRAIYYAVAGHFEALVRKIDVCALVRMLFGLFLKH